MDQVPDFWRTEVWHPLSVHFPIALLIFSTLSYIAALIVPGQRKSYFFFMAKMLLVFGVLGAWIGIYTGDAADGVVARKICDPTVLKAHEIHAYTLSILFSVALLLHMLRNWKVLEKFRNILHLVVLGLLLTGCGFLIYTGHLGATIVYQQGAGVFHPSADCAEFE